MKKKIHLAIVLCMAISLSLPVVAQTTITPELAFKANASTGEGSIWHPDRKSLFWVDIEGKTLYEFLPEKKTCNQWTFDRMVTTVVPETATTVIVALQNEIIRLNLSDGSHTSVAKIDDKGGTYRCNDGKCDPQGRLWIGTMTMGAPKGTAELYTVDSKGTVTSRLTGITTYNGIAVSIPRAIGSPDGMAIDKNGNIWVAQWGGYGVYCYNPTTGKLLTKIEVPAPNVASCAFGGEQLDILYITTARAHLSPEKLEQYPLSGSLFSCKPGVSGVPANRFK